MAAANLRGWYPALTPPLFAPPNAVLVPVWCGMSALYLAIGLAAWRIWRLKPAAEKGRIAMNLWGWQLALGAAWPAAFFGLHLLLPAAVLATAQLAVAIPALRRFAQLDGMAALLLLPYSIFAVAAVYLNTGFWWFNH